MVIENGRVDPFSEGVKEGLTINHMGMKAKVVEVHSPSHFVVELGPETNRFRLEVHTDKPKEEKSSVSRSNAYVAELADQEKA